MSSRTTRLACVTAAVSAVVFAAAGCASEGGVTKASGRPADWIAAICSYGPDGMPPMCRGHDDPAEGPLAFSPLFTIYQYDSRAQMQQDSTRQDVGFGSAQCVSSDGSAVVFIADVSGIGDRSDAVRIAAKSMQPLERFGCTIDEAAPSTHRPSVAAPVPAPAPPSNSSAPPTRVSTVTPDSNLQWRFQSATGNIACDLNGSVSPPEATCEVREHSYQPQVKPSCDPGWASSFRLVQGRTVEVNCYSGTDFRSALPVQDYGRPLTVGSLTCVIDESTGVTCKDSTTGHYFQAARQAYEWR